MFTLDFSVLHWFILAICAMLVGMSKVGVPGVSLLVVRTLALIFGGKPSTGVLLPMLMIADIFGVAWYHRHAEWKYLWKMLPWAFAGLVLGLWVGEKVNDEQFKNIIAILVFVCIGLMFVKNKKNNKPIFPDTWWFAAFMGVLGGFATMMGNVAGPIFAIYLLAMHLPKNSFIGTTAWFFMIINFTKFPLQYFVWDNISIPFLMLNVYMIPLIGLGAFSGIWLVKKIPEHTYRIFVIAVTALSAFLLLI
jgi:uncharacterized membrane protein YfcA